MDDCREVELRVLTSKHKLQLLQKKEGSTVTSVGLHSLNLHTPQTIHAEENTTSSIILPKDLVSSSPGEHFNTAQEQKKVPVES